MPQVMLINTRATWLAGPDAGLSTAYRFAPGVAVDVTDADAALLLDPAKVDGREFVKAGTDVAQAAAVQAAAVAEWKAGGYKPGKGDPTEDAEPSASPQDTASVEPPSASVTSAAASPPPGAARSGNKGG